jgi:hypothetical protein
LEENGQSLKEMAGGRPVAGGRLPRQLSPDGSNVKDSIFVPSTEGLHREGDKFHLHPPALLERLRHLSGFGCFQCNCVKDLHLLKGQHHRDIEGSISSLIPHGEVDVCRTLIIVGEEVSSFPDGRQSSCGS